MLNIENKQNSNTVTLKTDEVKKLQNELAELKAELKKHNEKFMSLQK